MSAEYFLFECMHCGYQWQSDDEDDGQCGDCGRYESEMHFVDCEHLDVTSQGEHIVVCNDCGLDIDRDQWELGLSSGSVCDEHIFEDGYCLICGDSQ